MIDWDRVAELKDEVGEEAFDEVAELFVAEVDEAVARLRAAPDPATLERDLHFLKGASLNLGFADFARLCREGERMAADGAAGAVDMGRVLSCYDASRSEFLSAGARAAGTGTFGA